jgi:multimeric flavodoxin WrbA
MDEPEYVLRMGTAQMSVRPYRTDDEDTAKLIKAIADGVKAAGGDVRVRTTTVEEQPY